MGGCPYTNSPTIWVYLRAPDFRKLPSSLEVYSENIQQQLYSKSFGIVALLIIEAPAVLGTLSSRLEVLACTPRVVPPLVWGSF